MQVKQYKYEFSHRDHEAFKSNKTNLLYLSVSQKKTLQDEYCCQSYDIDSSVHATWLPISHTLSITP